MIVYEKNPERTDITEALIELSQSSFSKDIATDLTSLPEGWVPKVADKRVVICYVGKDFFKGMDPLTALQYLRWHIYRLVMLFCHVQRFLLWWYDDGLAENIINKAGESERNKLEDVYAETIQYCMQNNCAIHDDSGNFDRALAWGGAYYGDESSYFYKFKENGKRAFLQGWTGKHCELVAWIHQIYESGQGAKLALPNEWQQVVSERTVVLFRLSPRNIFEEGVRATVLINCLARWSDASKNICIWWVVDKTLEDIQPLLSESVRCQLREAGASFRERAHTIYDESGDYERALSYADVCFGDSWHEVGLFSKVHQKIVNPQFAKLKFIPECPDVREFWQEGQKIWFIYNEREVFGALCEADLETDQVKIICDVPNDESHVGWGLDYYVMGKVGTKFIMAPYFSGESFFEYDAATDKSRAVPCMEVVWRPNKERYGAFYSRASWQGDLYFLGNGNGLIVQYRAQDGQYVYHRAWTSALEKLIPRERMIFTKAIQRGSFLHMALQSAPFWVTVNLADMTIQIKTIPLPSDFLPMGATDDGQSFCLLPKKGNQVLRWQPATGTLKTIVCPSVSASQNYPFSGMADWIGKKLIFPYLSTSVQVLEDGKEAAKPDALLTEKLVHKEKMEGFRTTLSLYVDRSNDGKYYTLTYKGKALIEFSGNSDRIVYHKLRFTAKDEERLVKKIQSWNQRNVLNELTEAIDDSVVDKMTAGQKIWQVINKG